MILPISNAGTGILPANEASPDIPDTLPLMKIDPHILIVSEGNPPYGPYTISCVESSQGDTSIKSIESSEDFLQGCT